VGWKPGCRAQGLVIARLSENQCGMETRFTYRSNFITYMLSENQCGMETEEMKRENRVCYSG